MLEENLIKIYETSFRENREMPALTDYFKGETFSYYEMAKEIAKLHLLFKKAGVKKGDKITAEEAGEMMAADLLPFERDVSRLVKVPLEQCQFDALVCFAYNVGGGALASSTLLKLLNAGDYSGAAGQFSRWNKANGKQLAGLTRRREAERALFEGTS